MENAGTLLQSIEDCISILQGDLHQPGTPAVVLKLASSWQKVKPYLAHHEQDDSDNSVAMVKDGSCSSQTGNVERYVFQTPTSDNTSEHNEDMEQTVHAREEQDLSLRGVTDMPVTDIHPEVITPSDSSDERLEQVDSETPVLMTGNGKELALELHVKRPVGSGGGDKTSADNLGVYATDSLNPTNPGSDMFETPSLSTAILDPPSSDTESKDSSVTVNQTSATDYLEPSNHSADSQEPTITDNQECSEAEVIGEEYQKVEFAVLYWHKTTGFYYDPLTQQFFSPTYEQDTQQPTEEESVPTQEVASDTPLPQDYYNVNQSLLTQSGHASTAASTGQSSNSGSGPTSIADMLAAASDRVVERCGYQYNEGLDMYYDATNGLYYHQGSKLYYDADLGCFYEYDYENKKYTVHSRVKLPDTEDREERKSKDLENISSSEEEYQNSPEEGEIRVPYYPQKSPPPEEEWAPCIRVLVSKSETLPKGTLFLVTQDGASIGREPSGGGTNSLIKIPELKVSKLHAVVAYDKHERCYMVTDVGSVNGTFLKDQRLSEAKERSKPYPLEHEDTLTLGSTTLTLHIHTGWETCAWCDPSRGAWQGLQASGSADTRGAESSLELDSQRKKELNRIKRKYGLSMKDTYGDKEVVIREGYLDRSESRRKKIGSDVPASQRPDDAPSSVHRPIEEDNKGRKMLEKMGWHSGGGLGRGEDGIMEPVRAEARDPDAKLGLGMSPFHADPSSATGKSQKIKKRYDDVLRHQKDNVKKRKLKDL